MRIIYILGPIAIIALSGCGRESPPRWLAELSPYDAGRVAGIVLAHGKITGCGSIEVTDQSPINKSIDVECDNGTTKQEHTIEFHPAFSVDGHDVEANAWDDTWLSEAYCVKKSDGKWDMAFIDLPDAHDRARALSAETGQPTFFYASDSLYYWETRQNDAGEWVSGVPTDVVKDRNDRRGCELEKRRLD